MSHRTLDEHIDLAYYYAVNAYNKYPCLLRNLDLHEIEETIEYILEMMEGKGNYYQWLIFDAEREVLNLLKQVHRYTTFLRRAYKKAL